MDILKEIHEQFKHNETGYGEPQAFIEADNDRSIEIVQEMEGLCENEYFYSLRLHCNETEFDNDNFHGTCGIVDMYNTNSLSDEELLKGLKSLQNNME